VIALIEDPGVIRRILEHLELWAPLPTERSLPVDPASWPPYASLLLTYHPFPTSPDLPHKKASAPPGRGKELAALRRLE